MSRFTPSNDNLSIAIDDSAVEAYVVAGARALLKNGARKVYFLGSSGRRYPLLRQRGSAGVTVVMPGQEPSNFLESSRIIHREGEIILVSGKVTHKAQWREVASEIEAEVVKHANAG
jgi:hypothetical protein